MTRPMSLGTKRNGRIRCAIYTRKSSEEGLEQEFNSLQAQREACEAFVTSQRHEAWVCLRAGYDDGGFSGATMARPGLQRLLADIAAGRVDIVVVYKIDRLNPLARRFCQDRRDPRCAERVVCFGDAAVQHHKFDGAPDPQCSVVLCAVRARGHRRAHPRQDRRLKKEGDRTGRVPYSGIGRRTASSSSSTARQNSYARSFTAIPNSARSGC